MMRTIFGRPRVAPARRAAAPRPRFRPGVEALEERVTPDTAFLASDNFLPTGLIAGHFLATPPGAYQWRLDAGNITIPTAFPGHARALGSQGDDATVMGLSQQNVRLLADYNLSTGTASTRFIGLMARYIPGSGDTNHYTGWVGKRGSTTYAEIWRSVGGAFTLLSQRVITPTSGTVKFDVESISPTTTQLALYVNNVPAGNATDSTAALQPAGEFGIRGWGGLGGTNGAEVTSFTAFQLVPGTFTTTVPAAPSTFNEGFAPNPASASPYLNNDLWTGRVGDMTFSPGLVTMAGNNGSVTTLNSAALANVDLQADVDLTASGSVVRAVGLTANYSSTGDSNLYVGWIASRSGQTFAEIWMAAPNDEFDELNSVRLTGDPTAGHLEFTKVGNYMTLTFTPTVGVAQAITAVDFHPTLLGPGQVGIRGWGSGPTLTNFSASDITPTFVVSLPYQDLNATHDTFYENSNEWVSRFGSLVHGTQQVTSVTPAAMAADPEEGVLNASIATVNAGNIANSTESAIVTLPGGSATLAGGVIARYGGPGDSNWYEAWIAQRSGSTFLEIWKNVNGSATQLASQALAGNPLSGTVNFNVSGSTLTATFNAGPALVAVDFDITGVVGTSLGGIRTWGDGVVVSNFTLTSP
jgi:hypothetical protein